MPKYYGCPCEGCGRPLALTDDIVVCPDCGAPYHRECYEKLGRCIHTPAHGAGYDWKFPYKDEELSAPGVPRRYAAAAVPTCRQRISARILPPRLLPAQTRTDLTMMIFTASTSRTWKNPPAAMCRRPLARKS